MTQPLRVPLPPIRVPGLFTPEAQASIDRLLVPWDKAAPGDIVGVEAYAMAHGESTHFTGITSAIVRHPVGTETLTPIQLPDADLERIAADLVRLSWRLLEARHVLEHVGPLDGDSGDETPAKAMIFPGMMVVARECWEDMPTIYDDPEDMIEELDPLVRILLPEHPSNHQALQEQVNLAWTNEMFLESKVVSKSAWKGDSRLSFHLAIDFDR